jgi:predicted CopG family antitoxin
MGFQLETSIMADDRTTIWISDELWKELNQRKDRGDSFEDVIWDLINDSVESEEESSPVPK